MFSDMSQVATCDRRGVTDTRMWHFFCHILASMTTLWSEVATCDIGLITIIIIFINDVCFLLPPSCRWISNKDRESNNVVSYFLPWCLLFLSCWCLLVCLFVKLVSTFNVVNNSFHKKYSKIGITVDKMSNGKELKLKLSLAIANLVLP